MIIKWLPFVGRMLVTFVAFMASILFIIWIMDEWLGLADTVYGNIIGGVAGIVSMYFVARPMINHWVIKSVPRKEIS